MVVNYKGKLWVIVVAVLVIYLLGVSAGKTDGASTRPQVINQLNAECSYPYAANGFLNAHCSNLIYQAARQGLKPSHATAGPDGLVNWN